MRREVTPYEPELLSSLISKVATGYGEALRYMRKPSIGAKMLGGVMAGLHTLNIPGAIVGRLVGWSLARTGVKPKHAKTVEFIAELATPATGFGALGKIAKGLQLGKARKLGKAIGAEERIATLEKELGKLAETRKLLGEATSAKEARKLRELGKLETRVGEALLKGLPEDIAKKRAELLENLKPRLKEMVRAYEVYKSQVDPVFKNYKSQYLKFLDSIASNALSKQYSVADAKNILGAAMKQAAREAEEIWKGIDEAFKAAGIDSSKIFLKPQEIDEIFEIALQKVFSPTTRINAIDALNRLLRGEIPPPSRMKALVEVLGGDEELLDLLRNTGKINKALLEPKNWFDKLLHKFHKSSLEIFQLSRYLKASGDVSFWFRQALPKAFSKEWREGVVKGLKAWSKDHYELTLGQILNDPYLPLAQKAKLHISSISGLGGGEEYFASQIAKRLPWLQRSEWSAVAFIDTVRLQNFKEGVKYLVTLGYNPLDAKDFWIFQTLADYLNKATGVGALPPKLAEYMSYIFFAPRLFASRLQYPMMLFRLPSELRWMMYEDLSRIFWAGSTFLGAGKFIGDMLGVDTDINTNPLSADFLKVRLGGTRIDPWGGFQQWVVFGARMMAGESLSSLTETPKELGMGYGMPSRFDILINFITSKFHPIANTVKELMAARKFEYAPYMELTPETLRQALLQFAPFVLEDAIDAYEISGIGVMIPSVIASLIGGGTLHYNTMTQFETESHKFNTPREVLNLLDYHFRSAGFVPKQEFSFTVTTPTNRRVNIATSDMVLRARETFYSLFIPMAYRVVSHPTFEMLDPTQKFRILSRMQNMAWTTTKRMILGVPDPTLLTKLTKNLASRMYRYYYDEMQVPAMKARLWAEEDAVEYVKKFIQQYNEKRLRTIEQMVEYLLKPYLEGFYEKAQERS